MPTTSYAVRWGIEANGETPDEVYAADYDAATLNNYWAIGIALSLYCSYSRWQI